MKTQNFNYKTYEICKPILDSLDNKDISYIVFGGFAIFLNILDYFRETNRKIEDSALRETEDIDIITFNLLKALKDIKDTIELVSEENVCINEIVKNLNIEVNSEEIPLKEGRKIDMLEKIQGRTYNSIEYKVITYQEKQYKVATPEELLSMKLEMVKLYGIDGVRKKDLEDIGVLSHLVETQKPKKKKGFLTWD